MLSIPSRFPSRLACLDAKSTAPGSGDLPPRKRRHRPRRAGVAELGVGGQVRESPRGPRPRAGGVPDGAGEALHPRGGSTVHGVVRPGTTKPRVPAGPRRRPAVFAAGENVREGGGGSGGDGCVWRGWVPTGGGTRFFKVAPEAGTRSTSNFLLTGRQASGVPSAMCFPEASRAKNEGANYIALRRKELCNSAGRRFAFFAVVVVVPACRK